MSKPIYRILALSIFSLALVVAVPAQSKGMGQAMQQVASDIKAKHHAAGRSVKTPPSKPLGSSKTVHFSLPMQGGKGHTSVGEYCMGYTLKCVATVKDPDNTYSGKVSTSQGSLVDFKGMKNGAPLELTLQTSFWGETTFSLYMWAEDDPFPEAAQVEMTCSY
ncbi:MAG: hypothetical protein KQI62_18930 [Deltaproteobacteria bacterium]|nr:hypothetical protein [Deltaproteobacteria bacterium]